MRDDLCARLNANLAKIHFGSGPGVRPGETIVYPTLYDVENTKEMLGTKLNDAMERSAPGGHQADGQPSPADAVHQTIRDWNADLMKKYGITSICVHTSLAGDGGILAAHLCGEPGEGTQAIWVAGGGWFLRN